MLEKPRRNIFIGRHWVDAFNRKELERFLALYWDYAEHYSWRLEARRPETKGLIKGKAEFYEWFKPAFELPLNYEATSITADDDQTFMQYIRHLRGEEDMDVKEILKILDGKITASRVEK